MKKSNIINYYQALCKDLNTTVYPIKFGSVAKGGACITHDKKGKIFEIKLDLNRCADIEMAILHELAHQLLIEKNNNYTHNSTFKKMESKLIDKYVYSKFTNILLDKKVF